MWLSIVEDTRMFDENNFADKATVPCFCTITKWPTQKHKKQTQENTRKTWCYLTNIDHEIYLPKFLNHHSWNYNILWYGPCINLKFSTKVYFTFLYRQKVTLGWLFGKLHDLIEKSPNSIFARDAREHFKIQSTLTQNSLFWSVL